MELKPCPFCGGDARRFEGALSHGVLCRACGARIGYTMRGVAEKIWNRRAETSDPVKHGRWVSQKVFGQELWCCSECKTVGSPQWKRCPICEAKMDKEDADG